MKKETNLFFAIYSLEENANVKLRYTGDLYKKGGNNR